MVNARREELERLERQRLEVNRKLENLMKRYSRLTGDRKPAARRVPIGRAPNDWKPSINASGVKIPMKPWAKAAIIAGVSLGVILFAAFMIHSYFVLNEIDPIEEILKFFESVIEPI